MRKSLMILLAASAMACGTASKAGPKTSNPPLTPDQKAKRAPKPPAAPDPFTVEGATIKFHALGFSLTVPSPDWKGTYNETKQGVVLVFERKDLPAMAVVRPVTSDLSVKDMADVLVKDALSATKVQPGAPAQEPSGRWSFTLEVKDDNGDETRVYVGVQELPNMPKRFLIVIAFMPKASADALTKEVQALMDSAKAL